MKSAVFILIFLIGICLSFKQNNYQLKKAYCEFVKDKHVSRMFNLKRSCTSKVRIFHSAVCVVEPDDDDSAVELSCVDISTLKEFIQKSQNRCQFYKHLSLCFT